MFRVTIRGILLFGISFGFPQFLKPWEAQSVSRAMQGTRSGFGCDGLPPEFQV